MTDYISREEAIKVLCDACGNAACPKGLIPRCSYYETMQAVPAADVRPVVRCGECKYCVEHYDTDGNAPYWVCKEWDSGTDYDGYCHYGERKDGDGNV